VQNLYGPDLADKGPQLAHLLIIYELADLDLQGRHIEEADTDLVAEFAQSKHIAWLVSLLCRLESTFGHHVAHLTIDDLIRFG
jgi:hypothetical protein